MDESAVDGKMLTDAYWCLDAYWYFVMYTIKMLTDTKRYIFDALYIYDLPMTSNNCKQKVKMKFTVDLWYLFLPNLEES